MSRNFAPLHGYATHISDATRLRAWWHVILGNYGKLSCYGIILGLPSDIEVLKYLKEFGNELSIISGNKCLIIFLTENGYKRFGFDKEIFLAAVDEHISNGYSVQVANLFDVPLNEFPCMLFFNDIRSSNHVIASLRDMNSGEIAKTMRSIFSVVQKAVIDKQDPIEYILKYRNSQEFLKKGKTFISEVRHIANITFETAIEAWMKVVIK